MSEIRWHKLVCGVCKEKDGSVQSDIGGQFLNPDVMADFPCPRCCEEERRDRILAFLDIREQERSIVEIEELRELAHRSRFFVDDKGVLYRFKVRYPEGAARGIREDFIGDLTRLKEENKDLLIENARLRRKLEGK